MRILVVSDLHGRHEALSNGIAKFEKEGYDIFIQLGDLADSYDRTNEDIMRCFFLMRDLKEKYGERVQWLIGNHCLHYLFDDEMCSGFRATLMVQLSPWLQTNRSLLKVAHQEGIHLFTHAGVQKKWFNKHKTLITDTQKLLHGDSTLADCLNTMLQSAKGKKALCEVGTKRGGMRGDYGGPFWCDATEMESYGPIPGYHQYVGHTPQNFVRRVDKFEGDKHYNNTSVTFCDILGVRDEFTTVEI